MSLSRARYAIVIGAFATVSIDLVMIGCSSDKPSAASGTTDFDAATTTPEASIVRTDAGAEAATDAAIDHVVVGPCLDEKPAPMDGGTDAAAPQCPETGDCSAVCTNIVDHYKLGVAQVAVDCVLKLASCSVTTDVLACVDTALGMACVDPSSKTYCAALVKSCDPNAGGAGSNIDEQGCESFANGMTTSGRSTFGGCIQGKIDAGTCPAEVVDCANQIRQ